MAFIPDEAVDQSYEISAQAFRVYAYICRRRNHQKQYAWISVEQMASAMMLSKSTIYEAVRELENRAWLERSENAWYPRFGNFEPVDKRWRN
jgi:DNA-binding MarR family transcriptional regulator